MKIKLSSIISFMFVLLLVSVLASNLVLIAKLDSNRLIDTPAVVLSKDIDIIPDFELIDGELPD